MADNEKLVTDIIGKIEQADKDISTKRDEWLQYYKMYRGYRDDMVASGRSAVSLPVAFEWVEVVKSRLFDVFCGKKPYVRVRGREASDDYAAKGIQAWQNYQYDIAKYKQFIRDQISAVLIFGTCVGKIYWKYQEGKRDIPTPIFPQYPEMGSIPQEQTVTIYDNVCMDYVDPFDFSMDPDALTVDEAEWCSHKVRRDEDYIIRMAKLGIYKNVNEMIQEVRDGSGRETNQNKEAISSIEGHTPNKGNLMKPFDIIEYCEDDRIITIGNGKHLLQDKPNKNRKKMYVLGKIISVPNEPWGISLIEAGAQSAKVMEDLLNNGMDNLNFSVNQMFGVDEDKIEDTELVSSPGKFFHTRGNPQDAIFPLKGSDVAPSLFNFFALMSDISKRVTGVNDYMTGQSNQNRTATEASLLTNEAAKRIGLHINVFGDTFIGPVAEMVHQLNGKYSTAENVVRVTSSSADPYEMVRVTPEMFGANVDFIWESEDRELNNMVAVQQLTQALTIAQSNPSLWGTIPIIFYKILEKYGMHENDELMKMIEAGKQMAMMMMLQTGMQGAMMGAEGGGPPGMANPQKLASGQGNVSQSMGKKTTPQHGSVTQVRG
jgi:hypothetical protein